MNLNISLKKMKYIYYIIKHRESLSEIGCLINHNLLIIK